ncbi:MAG: indolepyruvate oxidoreductase subunit beta [Crenarchaeota archaeon]|nr:indolepyruvate oxidoreductase subunit beta [Thermoproteota archaeon]
MKINLVFTGVGGQGVVVLSDIFCEAAMIDGFDVAKAEVHGMAQRGGSINAFVRIGEKIVSPLVEKEKCDIIIGFEILETARILPMLKPNGTIIVNKQVIPPTSVLQGKAKSISSEELITLMHQKTPNVYQVEGPKIAQKLGNMLVVNTILLGAVSALNEIPIKKESYKQAMSNRLKGKYVDLNLQAFQLGRESVLVR